jgi:lysophospholipase L1-like esterase
MRIRSRVLLALTVAVVTVASVVTVVVFRTPTDATASRVHGPAHWLGAWGADMTTGGRSFHDQTIREVVRPTISGTSIRLHVTNWLGSDPLALGEVDVAVQSGGGSASRGSSRAVHFGGSTSVIVPAGQDLVSDPVPMRVKVRQNLLVSIYLPGTVEVSMWHSAGLNYSYVSAPGDHARAATTEEYPTRTGADFFVDGLDVETETSDATVVAFGDSITDGTCTGFGKNTRWPDDLSKLIGPNYGVVDAGIAGNRVLTDAAQAQQGLPAAQRFVHDALGVPGVRVIVLLEGINDIRPMAGPYGYRLTAADLIAGYQDLIALAHRAHVRIVGGTLLPYQHAWEDSAAGEAVRVQVNRWILTSGAFDGVIDFASAVGSHSNPAAYDHRYDCGDHLHPNASGAKVLATDAATLVERLAAEPPLTDATAAPSPAASLAQ